jgi:hypothetical protein
MQQELDLFRLHPSQGKNCLRNFQILLLAENASTSHTKHSDILCTLTDIQNQGHKLVLVVDSPG